MNAPAPRPNVRLTVATVDDVRQISPSFRRVRLRGDFTPFVTGGLHFRFLLGPPGVPLPTVGPEGLVWPGSPQDWHRPAYTVRKLDPAGGWIDVDIFLHDGGRVTAWTETLKGGEEVGLTGPGGGGLGQGGWQGLIGDETALPVVLRMIEALPPEARGQAFIRVPHAEDTQDVALPPGFRLHWITGRPLTHLLDELSPPAGNRFLFFAGEKAEAEQARLWMTARGIEKGESRAAAYWTLG